MPFARLCFFLLFTTFSFSTAENRATPVLPVTTQKYLDSILAKGLAPLDDWKNNIPEALAAEFESMEVTESGDKSFPHLLIVNGNKIERVKGPIGEGHNALTFLTPRNTVLKVAKNAKATRANVLVGWIQPYMEEYGLAHAHIIKMHPRGLYVEQEYIPSASLDVLFGHSKQGIPGPIQEQIWAEWEKAEKMAVEKNIWLDFKAPNFAMRRDGKVANVDFGPCLGAHNFDRYFRDEKNKKLEKSVALDNFFYRQIRKGSAYDKPKDPEAGWKQWRELEAHEETAPGPLLRFVQWCQWLFKKATLR